MADYRDALSRFYDREGLVRPAKMPRLLPAELEPLHGEQVPPELVTQTEIARRLGVHASTVHAWRRRHPGFPESMGARAYDWAAVKAWHAARRRGR